MSKLKIPRFVDIRFLLIYKVEELDEVKNDAN